MSHPPWARDCCGIVAAAGGRLCSRVTSHRLRDYALLAVNLSLKFQHSPFRRPTQYAASSNVYMQCLAEPHSGRSRLCPTGARARRGHVGAAGGRLRRRLPGRGRGAGRPAGPAVGAATAKPCCCGGGSGGGRRGSGGHRGSRRRRKQEAGAGRGGWCRPPQQGETAATPRVPNRSTVRRQLSWACRSTSRCPDFSLAEILALCTRSPWPSRQDAAWCSSRGQKNATRAVRTSHFTHVTRRRRRRGRALRRAPQPGCPSAMRPWTAGTAARYLVRFFALR